MDAPKQGKALRSVPGGENPSPSAAVGQKRLAVHVEEGEAPVRPEVARHRMKPGLVQSAFLDGAAVHETVQEHVPGG